MHKAERENPGQVGKAEKFRILFEPSPTQGQDCLEDKF